MIRAPWAVSSFSELPNLESIREDDTTEMITMKGVIVFTNHLSQNVSTQNANVYPLMFLPIS